MAFQRTSVLQMTTFYTRAGSEGECPSKGNRDNYFLGIRSNSFNQCYQIYYSEAHEYEKVSQALLLSAAKQFFAKPHLDLFAFFPL